MPQVNIENFDDVDVDSYRMLDPGVYTVNVQEEPTVKMSKNNNQQLELTMKVIEGVDQKEADPSTGSKSPAGRVVKDWIAFKAAFRIKKLLIAAGILRRDDRDSDIAKGKFETGMLIGTKFQIKLVADSYNGKEQRKVEYVI